MTVQMQSPMLETTQVRRKMLAKEESCWRTALMRHILVLMRCWQEMELSLSQKNLPMIKSEREAEWSRRERQKMPTFYAFID